MVYINGDEKEVAGMSVLDMLAKEGYNLARVAIERNGEIVPKAQYETTVLESGDHLEVVSFVGGG